jgi:hypothetical protein
MQQALPTAERAGERLQAPHAATDDEKATAELDQGGEEQDRAVEGRQGRRPQPGPARAGLAARRSTARRSRRSALSISCYRK